MTDPRFTDPRYTEPTSADSSLRRDYKVGGIWGWIAALAVVALIGFLMVAGWNSNGVTVGQLQIKAVPECAPQNAGNGVFYFHCYKAHLYAEQLSELIAKQQAEGLRLVSIVYVGGRDAVAVFEKR